MSVMNKMTIKVKINNKINKIDSFSFFFNSYNTIYKEK